MVSEAPSRTRYRLLLFATAFLFSTGGAAIKGCNFSSWQIACFRSGVAALTLWALLPEARRGWNLRTWLIGSSYAATLVLFVLATKLTTSANAVFLQSTAPLYVLVLAPLVLHESIRRVDVAVMCGVAAGVLLLLFGSQRAQATAPDPVHGNLLGLGSGLTWAITVTGLRWFGKSSTAGTPAAVVLLGNFLAFVVCLPMALPASNFSPANVLIVLYLGIFQIGLAYIALTRSIRHVPALEAATLLLLEPVFNPIWTWLLQREYPGRLALLGGFCILTATFGGTLWQARSSAAKPAVST
jgi:drug/metabolite transporter (DMT)-like permease